MRTLSCPPEIEVIGKKILSIAGNLSGEIIEPLLEKHGLDKVEPEEWYPAQDWLNVINELLTNRPWTTEWVATGISLAENGSIPPEMEHASLENVLAHWDDYYQMRHRGGDCGQVTTEKLGDKHIKVTHQHLYPDALIYGIANGWARRFLPEGTRFYVYYDDQIPHLDQGGAETIIHVRWENDNH